MRTWCNHNPVGTRCEVLVNGEWRRAEVLASTPTRIHFWLLDLCTHKTLYEEEHASFRVYDYAAGLRKAQEMAKALLSFDDGSHVTGRAGEGQPNWADFDAAIENEIGKEWP